MKRLPAAAALLGLALATQVFAQQSAPASGDTAPASQQHLHRFDAPTQLQRLTKQLQLTADQQAKIGPLLQQRDQQLKALHADTTLKPADRRAKTMALVQDSDNQITAVLTPEQRDKWKSVREKALERMQEKRGQTVPSAPGSSGN